MKTYAPLLAIIVVQIFEYFSQRPLSATTPMLFALDEKVDKRKSLLSAGINSLTIHLEYYVESYLRTVHFNRVKEKTKERYLSILNCHLKGTVLGRKKIRDLTLALIQSYYNTLPLKQKIFIRSSIRHCGTPELIGILIFLSSRKYLHYLRNLLKNCKRRPAGMEPLVVSKLLSHSDINTTLRTYIHVLQDLQDATADTTDAFYSQLEATYNQGFTSNLCQNIFL